MGKFKRKGIPRRRCNLVRVDRPEVVFTQTLIELLSEMQSKYPALYPLSAELDHKLLDAIAYSVFVRLTHVANTMEREMSHFLFSSSYRSKHPHGGDFALIESTLRRVEGELGRPHAPISEQVMLQQLDTEKLDIPDVRSATTRILDPIAAKVIQHIRGLDTAIPGDSPERKATVEVRLALKKNLPFIKQVLSDSVLREALPGRFLRQYDTIRMKMYGEPYMPARELYMKVIGKFNPLEVHHCRRIFNLVLVTLRPDQRAAFIAMSGTVVGKARIICRELLLVRYTLKPSLMQNIKEFFGIAGHPDGNMEEQEDDADMEVGEGESE